MFILSRCYKFIGKGIIKYPSRMQFITTVNKPTSLASEEGVEGSPEANDEPRKTIQRSKPRLQSDLKPHSNLSMFRNSKPRSNFNEKDSHQFSNDPDNFGTMSVTLKNADEAIEVDEDDVREKHHLENVPSAHQKLTTKQYADMIKIHLRDKNLMGAINVLEERMLKQDRVKPESYIYNLLIGACGRTGQAKQAFHLYNNMKKRSLKITGGTYTALFNACATSFYPKDALKRANRLRQIMMEKQYQPNQTNYHAMIKAYGHLGDISTAFALVDEMIYQKVFVSSDTVNFLIQACISNREAGFRHALLVWRKMRDHKIKPSIYTYNLMLRACQDCQLGETKIAQDLLQKIANAPTLISDSEVKNSHHEATAIEEVKNTNEAPSNTYVGAETGSMLEKEDFVSGSELTNLSLPLKRVDMNWPNLLAIKPRLGSVMSVSEEMSPQDQLLLLGGCSEFLEQMALDGVQPNIKTFTQLMALIPNTRTAEKELMRAMKRHTIPRDIEFYNSLIKKHSLLGDHSAARDVLPVLAEEKLKPDIITYGVLALSCRSVEKAEELLEDIDRAGFRVNAEVLGALLKQASIQCKFGYVLKMMEVAKKDNVELNPQFYQHLERLYKRGRQMIYDKQCGRPIPKFFESDYFVKGFSLFCARYKTWLKETQKLPPDLRDSEQQEMMA